MRSIKKLRSMRGDTIVEVLIAMAVLALVLSGAYYTAGLSYRNVRDSQEHTEAVAIAESQVEDMRLMGQAALGGLGSNGCLTSSLTVTIGCTVNSAGGACTAGLTNYCYTENDSYVNSTAVNDFGHSIILNTYKIQISWFSLNGNTDYVTLYYRVDS